ncbi:MAG TPA: hypothetical protein VL053_14430 [Arachidicoccus sp.]|nr:hypothetical protein [Arachidicoccus sp.]
MAEDKNTPARQNGPSEREIKKLLRQHLPEEGSDLSSPDHKGQDLSEDSFYQDALEGLKQFESTESIRSHSAKINKALNKNIRKSSRKKSLQLGHVFWYIIAVIVVVMMILLAFAVIRLKN